MEGVRGLGEEGVKGERGWGEEGVRGKGDEGVRGVSEEGKYCKKGWEKRESHYNMMEMFFPWVDLRTPSERYVLELAFLSCVMNYVKLVFFPNKS